MIGCRLVCPAIRIEEEVDMGYDVFVVFVQAVQHAVRAGLGRHKVVADKGQFYYRSVPLSHPGLFDT